MTALELNQPIIKFDWLTVTFQDYYDERLGLYDTTRFIEGVLGLDSDLFTPLKRGRYGYRSGLFYNNINIYFDGQANMGICLDISGKGCNYLYTIDFDFRQFFILCNSLTSNVTRIDLALDLFNNEFDYKELSDCYYKKLFSSRWRKHKLIISNDNTNPLCTGQGFDLQFGSRSSASMLRIYNKKVESNVPDDMLDYWCRCELQTRDEVSHSIVVTWLDYNGDYDYLASIYIELISRNLRFVCEGEDNTITRRQTKEFWQRFISAVRQSVILRHKLRKKHYSLLIYIYLEVFNYGQELYI